MTLQDKIELRQLLIKLYEGNTLIDWVQEFDTYLENKEISLSEEEYKKFSEEQIRYGILSNDSQAQGIKAGQPVFGSGPIYSTSSYYTMPTSGPYIFNKHIFNKP